MPVDETIHLHGFAGLFVDENQLLALETINARGVRQATTPSKLIIDGIVPLCTRNDGLGRPNAGVADDAGHRCVLWDVELQPTVGFQRINLAWQRLLESIDVELMELKPLS